MVPFGRTAAIFDVDDSLLDGNAGTIFTWYLYSERVMRSDMRSRVPRIIYEYARNRLTEQDMVEVGSRCQQGLYADDVKAHAHLCFERHLRKRITSGAIRQIRKHLLSGHFVAIASGSSAVHHRRGGAAPARPRGRGHANADRGRQDHRPDPPAGGVQGREARGGGAADGALGPRPLAQLPLLGLDGGRPALRGRRLPGGGEPEGALPRRSPRSAAGRSSSGRSGTSRAPRRTSPTSGAAGAGRPALQHPAEALFAKRNVPGRSLPATQGSPLPAVYVREAKCARPLPTGYVREAKCARPLLTGDARATSGTAAARSRR